MRIHQNLANQLSFSEKKEAWEALAQSQEAPQMVWDKKKGKEERGKKTKKNIVGRYFDRYNGCYDHYIQNNSCYGPLFSLFFRP